MFDTVFGILIIVLNIYSFIVLARVIMTWIPNVDHSHPIAQFLYKATEPVLRPIRDALPQQSGLDFSPLIVLIAIMVLTRVLANF